MKLVTFLGLAACWSDRIVVAGWNDITGALTYKGQHHVFQGCPVGGQPGSAAKGWHHTSSTDLVHWIDRGIDIVTRNETWEGFTSKDSPCSGFVTVDDGGTPCAGFRQCSSTTGLTKLNPAAKTWDGPMELRCANDSSGTLSGWGPSEYLFPVYYYRALPYDPPRPWQDFDGKWYLAVSTDGCNSTTRSKPCKAGGRLDLWTSPRLRGASASWRQIGPMVTTNANPLDNTGYNEFVTTDFFGAVPGDPRAGRTRVITNNGGWLNQGTPIYYLGLQANGGHFVDSRGDTHFRGPGEMGMLDWGAFTPNLNSEPGVVGTNALLGGQARTFAMSRTLGGEPNQVAVSGRRLVVAWLPGLHGGVPAQSLARDITLGNGMHGEVELLQQFAPELKRLRLSGTHPCLGSTGTHVAALRSQQFELITTTEKPLTAHGTNVSKFLILADDGAKEFTEIGVNWTSRLVYIDATRQGGEPGYAPKGPDGKPTKPKHLKRAGPLLGNQSQVSVHLIVDHSIVTAIFNNRTAITVFAHPSSTSANRLVLQEQGAVWPSRSREMIAWNLATANENRHVKATKPWWIPQIHYVPACL